jgi:hypothetical protein
VSTSVAYLKKRLADIGRYDLLDAAEAGLVSHFAAAEEAGLVRRREVLGNGSPNQAKKRAWTLARVTRQAEPLAPAKFSPGQAVPNFSQGARRTARDMPDLTAALAEWEEAQKPASMPKAGAEAEEISSELTPYFIREAFAMLAPTTSPRPRALDDSQITTVMAACRPLAPGDRDAFLQHVAAALAALPALGDGVVSRACRETGRRPSSTCGRGSTRAERRAAPGQKPEWTTARHWSHGDFSSY